MKLIAAGYDPENYSIEMARAARDAFQACLNERREGEGDSADSQ